MKAITDRSIRWKVTVHVLVVVGLFGAGTLGSVTLLLWGTEPPATLLWLVLALTILAGLGAVTLLYLVDRHLLRPLERLSSDATTVAQGDLDHEIQTHWASDEMGELARSIRTMHDQLTTSIEELTTFRQAVDQAGHQVIITDRDGTIEYVNSAFESVTGYEESDVIGKTPGILSAGETDPSVYDDLWETILSGETWMGELVNKRQTGERYYVKQTIAPVESADGTIEGFVSIGTDVTEAKLRRQVLEVYNRVLRHDLRNRVNVITGNADVIHTEYALTVSSIADEVRDAVENLDTTDESAAEMEGAIDRLESTAKSARRRAETIQNAGRRLQQLNDKATKANAVTDVSTSPRRSVPVESVVRDGIESAIATDADATIETDLATREPVHCEETMAIAIEELVENAIHHNPDVEPTVRLEVKTGDDEMMLRVEDDGPGIPEYERAVLQQGEETPLTHGSGLGLWLVYWIVTMNGGTLEIHDASPSGTVVTITIPRQEHDEVAPVTTAVQ